MGGIFISSARGYIDRYRATAIEACQRLSLMPIAMEEIRPEGSAPLDVCLRMVADADALIAIIGHAFGSVPGDDGRCFTELEIRHASELGIPVHIFVVDPDQPWYPAELGTADGVPVAELKQRLADAYTTRPFTTVESFREDLILTLVEYPGRVRSRPDQRAAIRPPMLCAHPPYVMQQKFTGRTADLAAILDWSDSDDPVMVIEGIGGLGKSALTWTWTEQEAPTAIDGLVGRFWWSFYEGSAQIGRFVQEALEYVVGDSFDDVPPEDQFTRLLDELRRRPYLLVLDGFERMLNAYHRLDPSKLRDDDVDANARGLIDSRAAQLIMLLASCSPSKILIGTRLMPFDLEGPSGAPLPGVRRYRLPDLSSDDAALVVNRLGVRGERRSIRRFFDRLGNHPLVMGVVCGMVRDYRRSPGNFDAWLADPDSGGAFNFSRIPLTQRHAHVLQVSLDQLSPDQEQLLGWLSVLSMAVGYETVAAINPFAPARPTPPAPSGSGSSFLDEWLANRKAREEGREQPPTEDAQSTEEQRGYRAELATWQASPELALAPARLDRALADLEERGLLWWDRRANTYDLHPVVRAYTHDRLDDEQRVAANQRVRDHFAGLPPEDAGHASTVEGLERSITIFRATLGTGDTVGARSTFRSRGLSRLIQIAAYPTAIELLDPIVDASSHDPDLLADLALARQRTGAPEEAMALYSRRLEVRLRTARTALTGRTSVMAALLGLADCLREDNQLAHATRHMRLAAELLASAPTAAEGRQYMGQLAFVLYDTGDFDSAREATEAARGDGANSFETDMLYEVLDLDMDDLRGIDITSALASRDWQSAAPETRRNALGLRTRHAVATEDWEAATRWASGLLRERRAAGMPTDGTLASLARIRMQAGSVDEAKQLIAHVTAPSVDHAWVAWQLDRDDATALAHASYALAWGDGAPYADHAGLAAAVRLFEEMEIPVPELPTRAIDEISIPYEAEVLAFIERVREAQANRDGDVS